jgi:hypothetical protein
VYGNGTVTYVTNVLRRAEKVFLGGMVRRLRRAVRVVALWVRVCGGDLEMR